MVKPIGLFNKIHKKVDLNSKEFYNKHPDLAPRNVYLSMNRTIGRDEINRTIENIGEPLHVRIINQCKDKIKKIFKVK